MNCEFSFYIRSASCNFQKTLNYFHDKTFHNYNCSYMSCNKCRQFFFTECSAAGSVLNFQQQFCADPWSVYFYFKRTAGIKIDGVYHLQETACPYFWCALDQFTHPRTVIDSTWVGVVYIRRGGTAKIYKMVRNGSALEFDWKA